MSKPLVPIVVSYSELDAFRQCPHKHELAYKQRWAPDRVGPALNTGRIWHEVMAIHYGCLMSGTTDHERLAFVADHLMTIEESDPETAALVAWMYDGYVECYGDDPDWEIVGVEDQRLIRLPTVAGRPSRFWLRMRVDMLVRERNIKSPKLWVVDHKSGRNLPNDRELDIDDQFGLYTWGLRQLGTPVFGSVYSAARTQRNKVEPQTIPDRFARIRLYRADPELDEIAREAYVTARTAYAYGTGRNPAPRAPDTDRCRWRCPFTEPCLMGRKAGSFAETRFLQDGGFTQQTEAQHLADRGYPEPLRP